MSRAPLLVLLAVAAPCAADPEIHTIALSGDPAQGVPGATLAFFADPRVNSAGKIAAWADLAGEGVTDANNGSVWSNRGGAFSLAEREGDAAPFGVDYVWAALPSPAFGEDGRLGFIASILLTSAPKDPVNLGLFVEDESFADLVVTREGSGAPGGGGALFQCLAFAPLADAGVQSFSAMCTAPVTQGLWSTRAGALDLVALRHTPAPGGNGLLFGHFDSPAQGAAGVLAFRASLILSADNREPVGYGVWLDAGAGPVPVALTGQSAPGTPPGVLFTGFGAGPVVDDDGHVTLWASLDGTNDSGLWRLGDSGLALVALQGEQAAGLPPGVAYGALSRQPVQAANGDVAFSGALVGDVTVLNNSAVWAGPAVQVQLVAREGDQAAGLPWGFVYASFSQPVINNAGSVAFLARVRPEENDGLENVALYATDPDGDLVPVVWTGEMLEVRPGDVRRIDEVIFDSGAPGSGTTQINDDGALVFTLTFTDGGSPAKLSYGLFSASWQPCRVDIDGNFELDVDDFIAFQTAFALGDLGVADFTGDGVLDLEDFIAFQTAFGIGCP